MTTEMPPPPSEPPTAAALPSPPAEPPAAAPKKLFNPLLAGLLGLAVGAGIVGGAWAYTSRDTAPDTFTLIGTFTLTEGAVRTEGENCRGNGGYDDIAQGTSVTVYDAAGGVAATGSLGESQYSVGACAFIVTVDDVPKGEKFYQVEVSHRGKVQLTGKEAEDGKLAATLG